MRVVVDASAAGNNSLAVCVSGWLQAWHTVPEAGGDVVHLVAPSEFIETLQVPSGQVVTHPFVGSTGGRLRAQHRVLPTLVREQSADALLASLPQLPLAPIRAAVVVVCYDLRHELRPGDFSRSRRIVRGVEYARAYRRADRITPISQRTFDDLARLHPNWAAKAEVVHLGADHFARAGPMGASAANGDRVAVTYGHYVNKRADLVLRAWRIALDRGAALPQLVVLGSPPAQRIMLSRLAADLGLDERQVQLVDALADADYHRLMNRTGLIVLASAFEGFGLPVLEGLRLGIPVVVTPEPAMVEVGGPAVTVAGGDSPEQLATAVLAALDPASPASSESRVAWADQFTWRATAAGLRRNAARALAERRR